LDVFPAAKKYRTQDRTAIVDLYQTKSPDPGTQDRGAFSSA
jgi:hypothetical protein